MNVRRHLKMLLSPLAVLVALGLPPSSPAYTGNNTFKPDIFPYPVSTRVFSIPLEVDKTVVIVPSSMRSVIPELTSMLEKRCGRALKVFAADAVEPKDMASFHLIVLGNLSDNRYARDLYNRRQAFADAYFPGKGGVIIHPTTSIWNYERNVLVIGVSVESDLRAGFEAFLRLLPEGASVVPALHLLKTDLAFPTPPANVDATLATIRMDFNTFPAWSNVPFWGLCYYISGDKKWADYFRQGVYALHERAQKSGHWVPEQWTTIYYELWRYFRVWRLLDEDPIFTPEDRRVVENLLWAYTWFMDSDENYPYYKPEHLTFGIRQNHMNFHALSLFYSHQYFKEKYGFADLDVLAKKYEPTFAGQEESYRSNDDAGYGYMYYTPHQTLQYQLMRGENSYLKKQLPVLADLGITVIDNRRDACSFGDFSYYAPRGKGSQRWLEMVYPTMAAWYFNDSECQWFYNWLTKDAGFTIDNLYYGDYAVDIPAAMPKRYLGVHPVLLDDAALKWVAARAEKNSYVPREGEQYVDKLSLRRNFEAEDEYLLLDGTSIFAHGHLDGNTITRLTWKDRIWLCEMDYIKNTPKYHNGVIVVRDGVQEPPPPLTRLAASADYRDAGVTRTVSEDFNGADWERNIIWKKEEYFLFLDRVTARENGNYRLESRWRTRGDTHLADNLLTVSQGSKQFRIASSDDAAKSLYTEPDTYLSNWNYPYSKKETVILLSRRDLPLAKGDSWTFSSLMQAADTVSAPGFTLRKAGKDLYLVQGKTTAELVGLDASELADRGVATDAGLFLLDRRELRLTGATRFEYASMHLHADSPVNMTVNFTVNTGTLTIPGDKPISLKVKNIRVEGKPSSIGELKLKPGAYTLKFPDTMRPAFLAGLLDSYVKKSRLVSPIDKQPEPRPFGLEVLASFDFPDTVTAFCADKNSVLCADARGRITRFEGQNRREVFQLPAKRAITALHAADINRDGISEIIFGDAADTLRACTDTGKTLWSFGMKAFYGANAHAVDITSGEPAGEGGPSLFVATNGFKAYGFDAKGVMKWETLIRYHPQTRIGYLKNGNDRYVAVGTVYSTPLNVVKPETGTPLWYTWEQVGDEAKSATDYCGIDLTSMVFLDTDGDGAKEIVFGTRFNTVYALNAADGATKWLSNVGGEVTALKAYMDPATGAPLLLAGTDSGDLFLLDRSGKRVRAVSLSGGVSDLTVVVDSGRVTILISSDDGTVTVLDDQFRVRAFRAFGNQPLQGIVLGDITKESVTFYAVGRDKVYCNTYTLPVAKTSRFN